MRLLVYALSIWLVCVASPLPVVAQNKNAAPLPRLQEQAKNTAEQIRRREARLAKIERDIKALERRLATANEEQERALTHSKNLLVSLALLQDKAPASFWLNAEQQQRTATTMAVVQAMLNSRRDKAASLATIIRQRTAMQQELQDRQRDSAAEVAALKTALQDLQQLITAKREAARKLAATPAGRAASAKATALAKPLIDVLTTQPTAALAPTDEPALASLSVPAVGEVVSGFGSPNPAGFTNRGITLRTRGGGTVVAPADGVVIFAGAFRGYGEIVILDHPTSGYTTMISGFANLGVVEGQTVKAGELLGQLAQFAGAPLYFELRYNKTPINPLPWLVAAEQQMNG